MHEPPNRISSFPSSQLPIPPSPTPASPGADDVFGPVDQFDNAEDEASCPLFSLCERIAERFVRDCHLGGDPAAVRSGLERRIRRQPGWSREQATALFDLALELRYLQENGRYRKPIAEVGRLIAVASGTELRPENN